MMFAVLLYICAEKSSSLVSPLGTPGIVVRTKVAGASQHLPKLKVYALTILRKGLSIFHAII